MKAEIIAVGTEILTGQIVNTNAQFLSEKCAALGIDVYFHTAVGDNVERLLSVLEIARKRSDLVLLCGGLGPTEDDLTKQTLAQFLGRKLVIDSAAMEKLDAFFAGRPGRIRTPNNDRQAELVTGSLPLPNPTGLAVGGMLEDNGVTYVVLPGPPSELQAMFTQSLQPLLQRSGEQLYSKVLRFYGIGESQLVTMISDLIEQQTDPTIAPYAKIGEVTLRLSTKSSNKRQAMERLRTLENEILSRENLRELCYGAGEDNSLANVVLGLLEETGQTLAVAEGLTGGLLQASLTALPACTAVFAGGMVVHEPSSSRLASETGACDEPSLVVMEKMAEQIRQETGADLGLAVTGIARSDQSEKSPVGTLFVALASEAGVSSGEYFLGQRDFHTLRQIACLVALDKVRRTLLPANSK